MRSHICNLTIARWEKNLGLHTRMWQDFKGLEGKMAIGGFLQPPNAGALIELNDEYLWVSPNLIMMGVKLMFYTI